MRRGPALGDCIISHIIIITQPGVAMRQRLFALVLFAVLDGSTAFRPVLWTRWRQGPACPQLLCTGAPATANIRALYADVRDGSMDEGAYLNDESDDEDSPLQGAKATRENWVWEIQLPRPESPEPSDTDEDGTAAIGELLVAEPGMPPGTPPLTHRSYFVEHRKPNKRLILDTLAQLLAVGNLPNGVARWPAYEPQDFDAVFSGLDVQKRVLGGDESVAEVVMKAHFVIHLRLGKAKSGPELLSTIMEEFGQVAFRMFGERVATDVRGQPSPEAALVSLIGHVPVGVPVAVLVEQYDAALVSDMTAHRWSEAKANIEPLRSLVRASQHPDISNRIAHLIVAGVACLGRDEIFAGVGNFIDLTLHPAVWDPPRFDEFEIFKDTAE